MISIIIPTYNEEKMIEATLKDLREKFKGEVIVSDSSADRTAEIARKYTKVVKSRKGRSFQMNKGARTAKGDILLFLHADTSLPENFQEEIEKIMKKAVSGAFRHKFKEDGRFLSFLSWAANMRSCFLKSYYGDQSIFVRKDVFDRMKGFRDMPIMEDVDFNSRIRKYGMIELSDSYVSTSSRRFCGRTLRIFLTIFFLHMLYSAGLNVRIFRDIYDNKR